MIFLSLSATALDFNAAFENAGKLYEQGRYAEAARAYEEILAGGKTSAAVYYNLGNALFKEGRVGAAVYYFRQAERLAPRDADVRANLTFIRRALSGGTEPEPDGWSQFLRNLSLNEWTWLALVPLWAWLVLLALGQWRAEWRMKLRGCTTGVGALGCVLAVLLAGAWRDHHRVKTAVVTAKEAVARYGPLAESKSHFTLRDGAEVSVLDEKDGWLQVLDTSDRMGWVRKELVVSLHQRPPLRVGGKS